MDLVGKKFCKCLICAGILGTTFLGACKPPNSSQLQSAHAGQDGTSGLRFAVITKNDGSRCISFTKDFDAFASVAASSTGDAAVSAVADTSLAAADANTILDPGTTPSVDEVCTDTDVQGARAALTTGAQEIAQASANNGSQLSLAGDWKAPAATAVVCAGAYMLTKKALCMYVSSKNREHGDAAFAMGGIGSVGALAATGGMAISKQALPIGVIGEIADMTAEIELHKKGLSLELAKKTPSQTELTRLQSKIKSLQKLRDSILKIYAKEITEKRFGARMGKYASICLASAVVIEGVATASRPLRGMDWNEFCGRQ